MQHRPQQYPTANSAAEALKQCLTAATPLICPWTSLCLAWLDCPFVWLLPSAGRLLPDTG